MFWVPDYLFGNQNAELIYIKTVEFLSIETELLPKCAGLILNYHWVGRGDDFLNVVSSEVVPAQVCMPLQWW